MSSFMRTFLLSTFTLLFCVGAVCASERVALVIGNANYRVANPLNNPRNDAEGMAALLEKAGFQVELQIDADLEKMQVAVARFGKSIREKNVKFGLFYYAGHGLQQDWHNYLMPVSANILQASDVPTQAVDVSDLLRYMQQPQEQRSFLVILDACRDSPFANAYKPAAKGLSQFDAPVGSLLAFATSPGNVAQDGDGRNGLYTGYLLREFAVPGARLEDAFKRVRLSVRMASKGTQIPWESTSLEEDVFMFPVAAKKLSEAERDELLENEIGTWLSVKNSRDPEVLAGFIRAFPSGSASELAQSRLTRLLTVQRTLNDETAQKPMLTATQATDAQEAARQRAAETMQKQLAAQKAEHERLRLAQQEADAVAEQTAMAAKLALAAELESQRNAAAKAQAAVDAAAKVVAAQRVQAQQAEQAEKLAEATALTAKLEAAKVAEIARQREKQAQLAAAEAARLASARIEQEAQDRLLAHRAEASSVAAEREAQLQQSTAPQLASAKPTVFAPVNTQTKPAMLEPTPFFKGYNEHLRRYAVGDEFTMRVIDRFSKTAKPLVLKVTQVDDNADRVTYNDGEFVSDLMGNITTNQRGALSTPRQFYPAELFVGKRWQTRFKQSRPNGVSYTFKYDLKVVGRERVTVPAGTFDCYKIEARGFNMELSANLQRDIWVAPGVNADIAHEIRVRLRNGAWDQNDRQELVSYVQTQRP